MILKMPLTLGLWVCNKTTFDVLKFSLLVVSPLFILKVVSKGLSLAQNY